MSEPPSTALWDSKTGETAEYVEINSNGNMMIKTQTNSVIWETQTENYMTEPPIQLIIIDECAFLRDDNMNPFWYIGTDCSAILTYVTDITLSNWVWLSNGSLNYDKQRICGYHSHTKELFMISGTYSDYIQSFNIETKQISTYSALPIEIKGSACYSCYTQINDTVYFVHNYTFAAYSMSANTLLYPVSDISLAMEGSLTCITASDDNQYIFIVGDEVFVYNIGENTLSRAPDMNMVRTKLSCNVVNDYLYAIGGVLSNIYIDSIERLYVGDIANIASETWSVLLSKMSAAKNMVESVVMNDDIYIMGGYGSDDRKTLNQVDRLDIDTLLVYQDNPMPIFTASATCSVVADNTIYTIYDTGIVCSSLNVTDATISSTQRPLEVTTTTMNITTTDTATVYPTLDRTVDITSTSEKVNTTTMSITTTSTQQPSEEVTTAMNITTTDTATVYPILDPTVDVRSTVITRSMMTATVDTGIQQSMEDNNNTMAKKSDNSLVRVLLYIFIVVNVFVAIVVIVVKYRIRLLKAKQKMMIEIQKKENDLSNEVPKVHVVSLPIVTGAATCSEVPKVDVVGEPDNVAPVVDSPPKGEDDSDSEELYAQVLLETCTIENTTQGNVSVAKPDVIQFLEIYDLMDMKERILSEKLNLAHFEEMESDYFDDLFECLGLDGAQEIRLRHAINELQKERAMVNEGKPSTNEQLQDTETFSKR